MLLAYLRSDAYTDDLENGVGICLTGNPAIRSDLLALVAKGLALNNRSTWFCSVHYLVQMLDNGTDEDKAKLGKHGNLFVDWFEKDFGNGECPYTYMQRAEVEEFLSARHRAGLATSFAATTAWNKLRWWSRDFIAFFEPKIVNIYIAS